MRIVWSGVAEADLDDLYDYIARDVPYYAEQFVDRLIEAVGVLKDHPRRALRPEHRTIQAQEPAQDRSHQPRRRRARRRTVRPAVRQDRWRADSGGWRE
jgi:plasmid stabilization system protein ParE